MSAREGDGRQAPRLGARRASALPDQQRRVVSRRVPRLGGLASHEGQLQGQDRLRGLRRRRCEHGSVAIALAGPLLLDDPGRSLRVLKPDLLAAIQLSGGFRAQLLPEHLRSVGRHRPRRGLAGLPTPGERGTLRGPPAQRTSARLRDQPSEGNVAQGRRADPTGNGSAPGHRPHPGLPVPPAAHQARQAPDLQGHAASRGPAVRFPPGGLAPRTPPGSAALVRPRLRARAHSSRRPVRGRRGIGAAEVDPEARGSAARRQTSSP